jgi:Homeodomain-like domain
MAKSPSHGREMGRLYLIFWRRNYPQDGGTRPSAYEVSTKKVEQLKKRFVEEGLEAALYRKPVTNIHRRKITGDEEAHVIALYCSQAPAGHERWTLRMLADKMVELDLVDSVSHETIRRTLKKMNLNPGKRKNGVFHRSKMLPLSAKWKKS